MHGCTHNYIINSTLFQNTMCTPFYIVPEQCSKCSRTMGVWAGGAWGGARAPPNFTVGQKPLRNSGIT